MIFLSRHSYSHLIYACLASVLAIACHAQDSTLPYQWINVHKYGALGDGHSNDTAAINKALKAAHANGPSTGVYFPQGIYPYSENIHLPGTAVCGEGLTKTILQAANRTHAAWIMTGDSPVICDLTIRLAQKAHMRDSHGDTSGLAVIDARNFLIRRVAVGPVAGAGIIVHKSGGTAAKPAVIQNCSISETMADGIHLTAGSSYIEVAGNSVTGTGDDLIAVVSYRSDKALCHDINIHDNSVGPQNHGRGISVVGGRDVNIEGNTIKGTTGAAIYLVSETSYDTYGVTNINIRGNTIENAVTESKLGHGAIHLAGRPSEDGAQYSLGIENVLIADNRIDGTTRNGLQIGPCVSGITITGNTIARAQGSGIAIGPKASDISVGSSDPNATPNLIKSCGESGVKVDPAESRGALRISGIHFESVNTRALGHLAVISLGNNSTYESARITDNHLEQPAGLPVEKMLETRSPVTDTQRNTANIDIPSTSTSAR